MTKTIWAKTAVASRDRAPLSGSLSADVVVIGAGVSGLSAAYFLADGGASVVLIEADRIGSGAVGRSSGFVNAGLWVPPTDIVKAIGEVYGPRLISTLGDAPRRTFELIKSLDLECDARNDGTLQCAPDEASFLDLKERLAGMAGRARDLKLVERQEAASLTGSSAYRGALIDYRAGYLQPLSYVRSLAKAAESAGTVIHEKSPAIHFEQLPGDTWKIWTGRGHVAAKQLLVATEAHMIGAHFGLSGEYVPMPFFNAATRRLTESEKAAVMPAGQPIVDLRKVVSSYRYDAHDRLVVGSIGSTSGPDGAINRQWVSRKIAKLFPILRNIEIEFAWTGRIGVTDNHMPTVHRIGRQAFALGGYNGRGIAAGTVFGEAISKVILGQMPEGDLPVPVTEPRETRMPGLRGMGLRSAAAAFHLLDARRG
ncbi:glycine/D-amino acid oxidase-like deaminating enzyme [Sinorhizobium fredii]|uniref:Putative oxidoreductase OrdL n=1 Tax=Sinorhizobium fredii (strain USDA 257) TaxID=1185652 RepID=I3XBV9_SINF2|nr:FAD-binding oxidoreductase [Sinorhizobium fredii]AFL53365.1 putative oxidoreductase OrdL [Sinorhizobium fredii USDA 257]